MHRQFLDRIYFVGYVEPYYKASKGQNCPSAEVIGTEEYCKAASIMLELKYQSMFDDSDTPIGCQYNGRSKESYFNSNSGLSYSNPKFSWGYGGVCTTNGMP